jgi:hypothetical protein
MRARDGGSATAQQPAAHVFLHPPVIIDAITVAESSVVRSIATYQKTQYPWLHIRVWSTLIFRGTGMARVRKAHVLGEGGYREENPRPTRTRLRDDLAVRVRKARAPFGTPSARYLTTRSHTLPPSRRWRPGLPRRLRPPGTGPGSNSNRPHRRCDAGTPDSIRPNS